MVLELGARPDFGATRQSQVCVRSLEQERPLEIWLFDGRVAGHLGPTVGLKTLSIHVCVCPHFGM